MRNFLWVTALALFSGVGLSQASTNFDAFSELLKEIDSGKIESYRVKPPVIHYQSTYDRYVLLSWPKDDFAQKWGLQSKGADGEYLLENDFLKVVQFKPTVDSAGESALAEEVLSIQDLDGRNVFYHLMKAREYFLQIAPELGAIQGQGVNRKIVVRVRADRLFNEETHFSEIKAKNMSVYIPPHYDGKWDREIWFYKRGSRTDWLSLGIDLAMSFTSLPLGPIFSLITLGQHHNSGIDFAKNPSWIYHEAFHWASDVDGILPVGRYSNPLSENLANYFGSVIEGQPEMGGMRSFTDRRLTRSYEKLKSVRRKKVQLAYDYTSFIPTALWHLRKKILGAEVVDPIAWKMTGPISEKTWPSEMPAVFLDALGAHEKSGQVREFFQRHDCSFHNLNERFKDHFKTLYGLEVPARPAYCK
jgi:hypothetical protein